MEDYRLVQAQTPEEQDITFVDLRVHEFNIAYIGYDDSQRLAIFIRGPQAEIVGGIIGYTYWGWLAVDLLWVHEDLQGKGYGTRLLVAAEQEARDRGCQQVLVDTFDFQAPGFYERHGYEMYGALDGFAGKYQRLYYRKRLAPRT